MKLKIKSSEVISTRVSGELFYEVQKRAIAKHMNIADYVKNALSKYMDIEKDGRA
jgi:predicted DNA binding CopG/RHH family protein